MNEVTLSIRIKLTLIVVLISLASFGTAAFYSTRWMSEEIEGDHKEKALLIWTHILDDLESGMVRRDHVELLNTLHIYRTYKDLEEVRVFNSMGGEVFFEQKGPPEPRLEEVFRIGETIRFNRKVKGRDVSTFIIPVKNKPECHACHGDGEVFRGALLLSLHLGGMNQYLAQQKQKFLLLFGLIALAAIAATLFTVNRVFITPLGAIREATDAVGGGEFNYRIPVKSGDEVGTLALNFNRMAQTLQSNFNEIGEKNKLLSEKVMLVTRSQNEWEETFNCITDAIAVVAGDCTILRVNKAFQHTFEEHFVSPRKEFVHRKCNEIFGMCLMEDCPSKKSLQTRNPVIREVHSPRSGKIFEVTVFPREFPREDFAGSVVIMKDVSEKKRDQMQMIMTERLASLGQMASGIAHEINNPLATISACTEGLVKRVDQEKMGSFLFRSYLKIIEEEVERCKKITTGMLSFVRNEDREKRKVDINEPLDKSLDVISFQGKSKSVEILRNTPRNMPEVLGNVTELMQVFLVVIINAIDAMDGDGTLTLETGTEGDTLFVRITDTGPGIPPDVMNRIFDPFFTTKSDRGGTGLGLSIADRIIREIDGKIEVTSDAGKGTSFKIILPIAQNKVSM